MWSPAGFDGSIVIDDYEDSRVEISVPKLNRSQVTLTMWIKLENVADEVTLIVSKIVITITNIVQLLCD